jgi:uncharacterized membrane protein YbhN (UPF0104 family)
MTALATPEHSAARHHLRPWAALLIAPFGDGVRRRSATDLVKLLVSIVGVFILGLAMARSNHVQEAISNAMHPPPQGIAWLVRAIWIAGSFGVVLLVIAVVAVARRFEVLRDVAVSVVLSYLACLGIQTLFGVSAGFHPDPCFLNVNVGFPVPFLAMGTAAAFTIRAYLSRGLQRTLEVLVAIAVICGLVVGAGLPYSLLASMLIGWGATAITRLVFGSPTGLPSVDEVIELLGELGVAAQTLVPDAHQLWGVSRYSGVDDAGLPLCVSLYGRDAEQTQLFAKIGRTVFLRKDVGHFALTRSGQLEHECYLTLLANTRAPGSTTTVRASGFVGPSNDGVVVGTPPPGRSIASLCHDEVTVSDAALMSATTVLKDLHDGQIAHGAIGLDRIVIDGDHAGLIDFERAISYAGPIAIAQDTASLLVSLAFVSTTQRSVDACVTVMGSQAVADALPFLQEQALSSELSSAIRKAHDKSMLKELLELGSKAANVEKPELAEIRRVNWTQLILTVGTLIGGWALIDVLLKVAGSFDTVKSASIPWVVATAVVAQVSYFGTAISSQGSITLSVPYFPLLMLELGNTFSGLALGTPATLAARVRFFQRQGMDATVAVSSGVLESTASWIVKGGLFIISIPFALGSMHLADLLGNGTSGPKVNTTKILVIVLIVVVVVGIVIGVFLAVPRWRGLVKGKIAPRYNEVVSHFKVLAGRPTKIVGIFGGMIVAQLAVAFALGTALHAYHQSLSLPVILVVLTLGSMLGGVSPVPGGMGVVEAGMILGLKAAGVPDSAAVAAVFVQRLFTAYLPPIAGWFALMWLRRKKYL